MSNSSKKTLSKKQILLAVAAVVIIVAAYFIFNRFSGGNGADQNIATSLPAAPTGELTVIDGTQAPETTGSGSAEAVTGASATATAPPVNTEKTVDPTQTPRAAATKIDENGSFYSKEDVALYIQTYGKLPSNFITKDEAKALGWSGNGSDPVDKYAAGKVIGGDRFGNYEGLLPKKNGRTYTECDIDTKGTVRGVKRIVFSNDGLIYYTEDHYENFELLYGNP